MASKYVEQESVIIAMARALGEDPGALAGDDMDRFILVLREFTDEQVDRHFDEALRRARFAAEHLKLARAH